MKHLDAAPQSSRNMTQNVQQQNNECNFMNATQQVCGTFTYKRHQVLTKVTKEETTLTISLR
jgi:hypothetical protein